MIEDFINFSQEKCKRLILEYQQTKEERIFHLLLAKYDRYILKVIFEFQRKCPSLRIEKLQELYHTGIIGFSKSLRSFKEKSDSKYICNHIKCYVISELRNEYIKTESDRKILEELRRRQSNQEPENHEWDLSVKMMLESKSLSKRDRRVLKYRYVDGLKLVAIGKKMNCHHTTIMDYLKKALKNLKKIAIDDNR
jgi:RNA polymerase sigma factor (sigma-70 family)